jgi:hypothetical protein
MTAQKYTKITHLYDDEETSFVLCNVVLHYIWSEMRSETRETGNVCFK